MAKKEEVQTEVVETPEVQAEEVVYNEVASPDVEEVEEEQARVVGGDGLVDGETTYGEDIKGNSTYDQGEV